MAQTFKRVCLEDYTVRDATSGTEFTLHRAHEYITSPEKNGNVTVYSQYWVTVPLTLFAGEKEFTPASGTK
jgi:hypothetical protein